MYLLTLPTGDKRISQSGGRIWCRAG